MVSDLVRDVLKAREEVDRKRSMPRVSEKRERIEQMLEFDPARAAERLTRLLNTARDRVPYYRGLVGRESLRLSDFPITQKEDLRNHFTDFIGRKGNGEMERGRYFINQTGGSTGQPVRLLATVESGGMANAVIQERINTYLELPETGTTLHLGLQHAGMKKCEAMSVPRPYVNINLPGFDPLSPTVVADYEEVVGPFPIDKITGSSSRVINLALYCRERSIRLRPKGIIVSHEHMPESGRKLIEETFDCRVTMLYMTSETGHSAWECRNGNMHFQDDFVVPEILPRTGREGGDVVLTNLSSTAMPIIRYVTGDIAPDVISCDCGLPGTVISELLGRARASLVGVDMELYSPYALLGSLEAAGIVDFQVVQEEPGLVDVISPFASDDSDAAIRLVNDCLASFFGPGKGFRLRLRKSEEFILTGLGKRNPVIQRLDIPLGPERQGYLDYFLEPEKYLPARA